MSPSVGRGSPMRDGSNSPARGRRSPRIRSERSPVRPRSSPRARSPVRTTSRARSPKLPSPPTRSPSPRTKRLRRAQLEKEADRGRARSPAREKRDRSPKLPSPPSRSPSPRTKRLRRAHLEKEADRGSDRERGRNNIREDGDKERHDGVNDRERGRNIIREGEKERHGRVSDRERGRDGSRERDKERHERVSAREHGRDGGREERRRDGSWEERVTDGEHGRDGGWEERRKVGSREHSDKERRYKEVSVDRSDRRPSRDKKDGESEKRSRHRSSPSPVDRRHSNRHNSRSPSRASRGGARDEVINPSEDVHRDENDSIARMKAAAESLEEKQKQKPSFELSGKLAEETNRVKGVTLLFTEPSDARKPDVRWRLYVFKGGEALNEPLYIHRQTCYLFGRERRVADVPTDHPSCSKQHAVIQYRQVEVEKPDGMLSKQVRPYIMDLGSTNGTFINDNRIESQRYYELFEKDTIKFGNSSREYVMLHENSA